MRRLGSIDAFKRNTSWSYGGAALFVAVATVIVYWMRTRWQLSAPAVVFLAAVTASTWLGGTRSGLLALALALVCFYYLILPLDGPVVANNPIQVLPEVLFAIVAYYVIWMTTTERSAAESLRQAHAELQRNNEALNAENAKRKQTEEELRASQQLLQQVLATLPVGVTVTDQAGDVILANAASKRIWGEALTVSGAERRVQSRGYWHVSGKRVAATEWASERALRAGQTSLNELIDIDAYDGQRKTIQNSAAPIRGADGVIVGAVIVNEEVTERVRAEQALQESANRLQQLSRRLLAVQEQERRRLSLELHDEFGQLLATITLHLHAAKRVAGEAAQALLDECMALLQSAGAQVRSLALELRPRMLETAGLDATLRWLAQQHQQRTGIATQVIGHVNEVSGELAIACFRVVQEALTNVARHAGAQHVWIELARSDGSLELLVCDDGVGFDVPETLERAAGGSNLGLLGMKERVQILCGTLVVDSQPGRGTRIRISLPAGPVEAAPVERVP